MIAGLLAHPAGPFILVASIAMAVFAVFVPVYLHLTRFKPRSCAKCGAPPWQWCTECYVRRRRPT